MKAWSRILFALGASFAIPPAATAEIRSGTITASTTLASLEVAGSLEITGADVVVTISSGAVTVGDGVQGARLAVTDGASLLVANRDSSVQSVHVGLNGGSGILVADGGTIDCYNIVLAGGASAEDPATGSLVLANGASVSAKNMVKLADPSGNATTSSSDVRSTVSIGAGCTLDCWALSANNACSNVVSFSGGTLQVAKLLKRGTGILELAGSGTAPIRIVQTVSPTVAAGDGTIYLFDVDRTGDVGPVVLSGPAGVDVSLVYPTPVYPKSTRLAQRDLVRFDHAGTTTLSSGTLALASASPLPKGGDFAIAEEGVLDLNGTTQTIGELSGAGTLRSAADAALAIGGSAGAFAGTIDVAAGTLAVATGHARRHYKVVVSAAVDPSQDFQFSEFALCDAKGERVNLTSDLAGPPSTLNSTIASNIPNLFDGDPTTGIWLAKNNAPLVFSFSLAEADSVVGYLFAPRTDKYANNKMPGTWTIYASDTAIAADEEEGWTEIASVSGFTLTGGNNNNTRGYGVTDGSMGSAAWSAFNNGAPVPLAAGSGTVAAFSPAATVSVASGATLDLSATGTALGRLSVDCAAGGGTINGGSLSTNGVLSLDYPASRLPRVYEVPLSLAPSVPPSAKPKGWRAVVNGEPANGTTVRYSEGRFVLTREGATVVIIR